MNEIPESLRRLLLRDNYMLNVNAYIKEIDRWVKSTIEVRFGRSSKIIVHDESLSEFDVELLYNKFNGDICCLRKDLNIYIQNAIIVNTTFGQEPFIQVVMIFRKLYISKNKNNINDLYTNNIYFSVKNLTLVINPMLGLRLKIYNVKEGINQSFINKLNSKHVCSFAYRDYYFKFYPDVSLYGGRGMVSYKCSISSKNNKKFKLMKMEVIDQIMLFINYTSSTMSKVPYIAIRTDNGFVLYINSSTYDQDEFTADRVLINWGMIPDIENTFKCWNKYSEIINRSVYNCNIFKKDFDLHYSIGIMLFNLEKFSYHFKPDNISDRNWYHNTHYKKKLLLVYDLIHEYDLDVIYYCDIIYYKDFRNDIAHGRTNNIKSGKKLIYHRQKMIVILNILVLKLLEIDNESVEAIINNSKIYDDLKFQKSQMMGEKYSPFQVRTISDINGDGSR